LNPWKQSSKIRILGEPVFHLFQEWILFCVCVYNIHNKKTFLLFIYIFLQSENIDITKDFLLIFFLYILFMAVGDDASSCVKLRRRRGDASGFLAGADCCLAVWEKTLEARNTPGKERNAYTQTSFSKMCQWSDHDLFYLVTEFVQT